MAEIKEVMDMRAASNYLGISRETLYKYLSEKRIPAFKLAKRWKFKKAILDHWMEGQRAEFGRHAPRRRRATAPNGALSTIG